MNFERFGPGDSRRQWRVAAMTGLLYGMAARAGKHVSVLVEVAYHWIVVTISHLW